MRRGIAPERKTGGIKIPVPRGLGRECSTKKKEEDMAIDNSKRQKCEIWTRAMGYCRPVSNFNKGKKSEFKERKFFREAVAVASMESCCGCHNDFGKKAA
jgi:hypothetical protein